MSEITRNITFEYDEEDQDDEVRDWKADYSIMFNVPQVAPLQTPVRIEWTTSSSSGGTPKVHRAETWRGIAQAANTSGQLSFGDEYRGSQVDHARALVIREGDNVTFLVYDARSTKVKITVKLSAVAPIFEYFAEQLEAFAAKPTSQKV